MLCILLELPFDDCSSIFTTSILSNVSTTPSEVSAGTSQQVHGLSIYYSNCRSILPKMDELRVVADSTRPDFIALTETWLGPDIFSSEVAIPSYQLIRRERSRHGGGISLFVSDSVVVTFRSCHESSEFLFIVVETKLGSMLLGLHYRPPGSACRA